MIIHFETDAFQKFSFTQAQIDSLLESAMRDLRIAQESVIPEISFKFSYDALIKIGMYRIAREGYRVRSAAGHHIKILEKLSKLTDNEDIAVMGNVIRQKRNRDLYEGMFTVTDKELEEFVFFVMFVKTLLDR